MGGSLSQTFLGNSSCVSTANKKEEKMGSASQLDANCNKTRNNEIFSGNLRVIVSLQKATKKWYGSIPFD
jgi:hypothetical protein